MAGQQKSVTLRFLAAPMDANVRGYVGGGKILEWIDKAGYAAAAAWSGHYSVTGYVGNIHLHRVVNVGDMVEVEARVVYTGRTSLQVVCTVTSHNPRDEVRVTNTQCLLVFVAMDSDGKPTPVPPFEPEDDWEREENERAQVLTAVRREVDDAMALQVYSDATETCRETLRFLAAPTDVNWGGKVHGGIVMRWIDEAAHVLVTSWTHNAANVAIFTGGVRFYRPLRIGDLVEVEARLLHTGPHSMHIGVHVRSGDPRGTELQTTTHCTIVYTARDEEDGEVRVRPWVPRLPEDRALERHAVDLIEIRSRLGRNEPHEPHAD